ncbi:hypothetical protein cypCar_00042062, partial [Cyprinus carpio]
LQILRVSKADEGVYRCEARVEARGEIDFRDIVVLVNVPPVLSVPQQSFNATADYQESVTFTCITSGSPDPQVTWYWKGHVIERSEQYVLNTLDGGKSTLTIKNIRQGDGGPYTCRASNKAGSSESQLFLKVFVQPHITQLRNVTAVEGSAAMISCTAEGEPLPEISWRRASDGQTFTDKDKVKHAPKFQTNQTIFYSWEGNPVNISCDVKSNPPASMLWRRDRFTISSQGTSNIRIHAADGRSLLEVALLYLHCTY